MSKKIIALIIVIAVVVIGCIVYFVTQNQNSSESESENDNTTNTQTEENAVTNETTDDNEDSTSSTSSTLVVYFSAQGHTEAVAQRIANEVAQVFITKIAKEYYNMDNVYVVDVAKKAESPYNVNHAKDLAIYGAIGFVVACAYILVINMLDTTVKSKEDIENKLGLTVLTTIPLCDFKTLKGGKIR